MAEGSGRPANAHWPVWRWRGMSLVMAGGVGGAAPNGSGPEGGSRRTQRVPFFRRVPAKRHVTRGFGVPVRVLTSPWPDTIRSAVPGGRRRDRWPAPGRIGGRSGYMGRRRVAGRRPVTLRAAKKSLDRGIAGFAKEPWTHDREVPCPGGSAQSGRASGTVDPYRRYLRYGTFKGPSSLRSRVGVGTVRCTWLIQARRVKLR